MTKSPNPKLYKRNFSGVKILENCNQVKVSLRTKKLLELKVQTTDQKRDLSKKSIHCKSSQVLVFLKEVMNY